MFVKARVAHGLGRVEHGACPRGGATGPRKVDLDGDRQPLLVRLRHEDGPGLLPQAQLLARRRPAAEHHPRRLRRQPVEGLVSSRARRLCPSFIVSPPSGRSGAPLRAPATPLRVPRQAAGLRPVYSRTPVPQQAGNLLVAPFSSHVEGGQSGRVARFEVGAPAEERADGLDVPFLRSVMQAPGLGAGREGEDRRRGQGRPVPSGGLPAAPSGGGRSWIFSRRGVRGRGGRVSYRTRRYAQPRLSARIRRQPMTCFGSG